MPSRSEGTEIPSDQFRLLVKHWLGMDLVPTQWNGAVCPKCGQITDTLGDHMVVCTKNDIKRRHEAIQGALADVAGLAGINVSCEVGLPDGSASGDVCFRPSGLLS